MDEKKIYMIDGLKEVGSRIGTFCMNNRAHICTGLSVVGTVTTGVLAARSGARSARKIDRKEAELGRRLTFQEKMALCGKEFIAPTISCIVASAGAVGSDVFNTQTIARTNAALLVSEQAYEKLSQKTKEVLGEKKAQQIQDEIAKEKIEQARATGIITRGSFENAPKSGNGTLYPFVDGYSNLPFWSNLDYINACVKDLEKKMREQEPRGSERDYQNKEVGVHYSDWLQMLNFDKNVWSCPEKKDAGWNRGYSEDGEDDDPIAYFRTTQEWEPGFAVTVITWEKDPISMKLGRLLKMSGMW